MDSISPSSQINSEHDFMNSTKLEKNHDEIWYDNTYFNRNEHYQFNEEFNQWNPENLIGSSSFIQSSQQFDGLEINSNECKKES